MLINVFSFILALVPSTLLQLLVAVMVLPVALTFTILSLIALRYTGLLVWNVISDYFRIGRFGQMPRPQHKGTWLQMLYGDMGRVLALEPAEAHRQFVQEAESEVLVYRHLAWAPRLLLADVGAMLFILGAQNVYSFPKPNFSRNLLLRTAGAGILIVEGTFIHPHALSLSRLESLLTRHGGDTQATSTSLSVRSSSLRSTPLWFVGLCLRSFIMLVVWSISLVVLWMLFRIPTTRRCT